MQCKDDVWSQLKLEPRPGFSCLDAARLQRISTCYVLSTGMAPLIITAGPVRSIFSATASSVTRSPIAGPASTSAATALLGTIVVYRTQSQTAAKGVDSEFDPASKDVDSSASKHSRIADALIVSTAVASRVAFVPRDDVIHGT